MISYIGLGSNLDNPAQQIRSAIVDLEQLEGISLLAQSSLYSSPPMGPQDQPDYINAVVAINTELSPYQLLDQLHKLEHKHGRERHRRWGERTLDLDILVYGDLQIDEQRLTIPHSGIPMRAFVLYPLAEIAPELTIPGMGTISLLCKQCPLDGLQKL